VSEASKADILKTVEASGCEMLKDKLDGTETKAEVVKYLHACKCPTLKAKYSLDE
jgi:hypothetical protein